MLGPGSLELASDQETENGHRCDMLIMFYFLINFNWRLITLQYCSGFAIH